MSRWQGRLKIVRDSADRWLLFGALLALGVSLLDPGFMLQRPLVHQVVVLDVTQSMNVGDMQQDGKPVTRLDAAKQALRAALLQMPCGSRVGWAVFTEYRSFLLLAPIEVCAHLDELRASLARIDSRMAWSGNSEIAKGLHSAIDIARQLEGQPALVFVTDGHEAPPLNPRFRPAFDDKAGEVPGLIVGVGDARPSPIPKTDPDGKPIGFWRADEVMQIDPRTANARAGGDAARSLAADPSASTQDAASLGATAGREHLSSLREGYLRLLAREQGMGFYRLQVEPSLASALMAPALTTPAPVRLSARPALAAIAFALLLLRQFGSVLRWLRATSARRTSS